MKKTLVALAALAVTSAFAQSSVTISGQLDGGFTVANSVAGVSTTSMNGGVYGANRLRFVGVEDMGGGNKVNFLLEMQPGLNGGTSGNGLFNRGAWLGMSGGWGEVRLGRQGTTTIGLVCTIDQGGCYGGFFGGGILFSGSGSIGNNTNPWFAANPTRGGAGQAISTIGGGFTGTAAANTAGTNTSTGASGVITTGQDVTRVVNAVTYMSPNFGGLTAMVQYGMSNVSAAVGDGSTIGLQAMYANGPLSAGLAYSSAAGTIASPNTGTLMTLGGVYNFGVVALGLGYQKEGAAANGSAFVGNFTDATAYAVTVYGNLGAFRPYIKFGNRTNSGGTNVGNTVAQMMNLGTTYDLSKRTKLYADYVVDSSPLQGATGAAVASNPTQFAFGLQHTF